MSAAEHGQQHFQYYYDGYFQQYMQQYAGRSAETSSGDATASAGSTLEAGESSVTPAVDAQTVGAEGVAPDQAQEQAAAPQVLAAQVVGGDAATDAAGAGVAGGPAHASSVTQPQQQGAEQQYTYQQQQQHHDYQQQQQQQQPFDQYGQYAGYQQQYEQQYGQYGQQSGYAQQQQALLADQQQQAHGAYGTQQEYGYGWQQQQQQQQQALYAWPQAQQAAGAAPAQASTAWSQWGQGQQQEWSQQPSQPGYPGASYSGVPGAQQPSGSHTTGLSVSVYNNQGLGGSGGGQGGITALLPPASPHALPMHQAAPLFAGTAGPSGNMSSFGQANLYSAQYNAVQGMPRGALVELPVSHSAAKLCPNGRPAVPLVVFGFGGRTIIVHGAPSASTSGAATDANQPTFPGVTTSSGASVTTPLATRVTITITHVLPTVMRTAGIASNASIMMRRSIGAPAAPMLSPRGASPVAAEAAGADTLTGLHQLLASFQGPLSPQTSREKLLKYVSDRAAAHSAEDPHAGQGHPQMGVLMWQLLALTLRHGVLLRPGGPVQAPAKPGKEEPADQELLNLLMQGGELVGGKPRKGATPTPPGGSPPVAGLMTTMSGLGSPHATWATGSTGGGGMGGEDVAPLMAAVVDERMQSEAAARVQQLLVQGKKTEAVKAAAAAGLWGVALLMAATCPPPLFSDTATAMSQALLLAGTPLSTGSLMMAGRPELAVPLSLDAQASSAGGSAGLAAPGTSLDGRAGSVGQHGLAPGLHQVTLLNSWRHNLAVLAGSVRTASDLEAVVRLGDHLAAYGAEPRAAQMCYLLAGVVPGFMPLGASPHHHPAGCPPSAAIGGAGSGGGGASSGAVTRYVLLGVDHAATPRTFAHALAIQRTEMLEFALSTGGTGGEAAPGSVPGGYLPSLLPYKLLYAHMLAEAGCVAEALAYCTVLEGCRERGVLSALPPAYQQLVWREAAELRERAGQFATVHAINLSKGESSMTRIGKLLDNTLSRLLWGSGPDAAAAGGAAGGGKAGPGGPQGLMQPEGPQVVYGGPSAPVIPLSLSATSSAPSLTTGGPSGAIANAGPASRMSSLGPSGPQPAPAGSTRPTLGGMPPDRVMSYGKEEMYSASGGSIGPRGHGPMPGPHSSHLPASPPASAGWQHAQQHMGPGTGFAPSSPAHSLQPSAPHSAAPSFPPSAVHSRNPSGMDLPAAWLGAEQAAAHLPPGQHNTGSAHQQHMQGTHPQLLQPGMGSAGAGHLAPVREVPSPPPLPPQPPGRPPVGGPMQQGGGSVGVPGAMQLASPASSSTSSLEAAAGMKPAAGMTEASAKQQQGGKGSRWSLLGLLGNKNNPSGTVAAGSGADGNSATPSPRSATAAAGDGGTLPRGPPTAPPLPPTASALASAGGSKAGKAPAKPTSSTPSGPKQANLGEEANFYYDEKKKRWVFPGQEESEEPAAPAAPPTSGSFVHTGAAAGASEGAAPAPPLSTLTGSPAGSGVSLSSPSFGASGRAKSTGLRGRYVDTFNAAPAPGSTGLPKPPSSSALLPPAPASTPAAAAGAGGAMPDAQARQSHAGVAPTLFNPMAAAAGGGDVSAARSAQWSTASTSVWGHPKPASAKATSYGELPAAAENVVDAGPDASSSLPASGPAVVPGAAAGDVPAPGQDVLGRSAPSISSSAYALPPVAPAAAQAGPGPAPAAHDGGSLQATGAQPPASHQLLPAPVQPPSGIPGHPSSMPGVGSSPVPPPAPGHQQYPAAHQAPPPVTPVAAAPLPALPTGATDMPAPLRPAGAAGGSVRPTFPMPPPPLPPMVAGAAAVVPRPPAFPAAASAPGIRPSAPLHANQPAPLPPAGTPSPVTAAGPVSAALVTAPAASSQAPAAGAGGAGNSQLRADELQPPSYDMLLAPGGSAPTPYPAAQQTAQQAAAVPPAAHAGAGGFHQPSTGQPRPPQHQAHASSYQQSYQQTYGAVHAAVHGAPSAAAGAASQQAQAALQQQQAYGGSLDSLATYGYGGAGYGGWGAASAPAPAAGTTNAWEPAAGYGGASISMAPAQAYSSPDVHAGPGWEGGAGYSHNAGASDGMTEIAL